MRTACLFRILATSQEIHQRKSRQPFRLRHRRALISSFAFYRTQTEELLSRYTYASMQVGRVPIFLGNDVVRRRCSSGRARSFEDVLIFVLDVERCIQGLTAMDIKLITRIAMQEYSQSDVGGELGLCSRTISMKYGEALDRLTKKLLEKKLLNLPPLDECQDGMNK